jgi:hypothetical protein
VDRLIDSLAKSLASGASRRTALRRIGLGVAGAFVPLLVPKTAAAQLHPCHLTCPGNITHPTAPGTCASHITYRLESSGACGEVVCTPPSGSTFPKGTTTVNCSGAGGAVTCSFNVTIQDHERPTITCPPDKTILTDKVCKHTRKVVYFRPDAHDNCPGVTSTCVKSSGSIFKGVSTVTCSARDTSGNTSEHPCHFKVSVFDIGLQDDSDKKKAILLNSETGDYRICLGNGMVINGKGNIVRQRFGTLVILTDTTNGKQFEVKYNCLSHDGRSSYNNGRSALWNLVDSNSENSDPNCGVTVS